MPAPASGTACLGAGACDAASADAGELSGTAVAEHSTPSSSPRRRASGLLTTEALGAVRSSLAVISSPVSHIAINAEAAAATLAFYEAVFGWRFTEAYPGFFRMEVDHAVRAVAVQHRRDLLPDGPTTSFEVIVSVSDVEAAVHAAIGHGGDVLLQPSVIPGVGELVWLRDPGGNVVGAMAYASEE